MVKCIYDTVSERDMDILFMESICADHAFAEIFTNKVKSLRGIPFRVIFAELSKTDKDYGESDLTIILEVDSKRVGMLIEDKLNAIAMDEQAGRYSERGKIGIDHGDYDEFYVFIVCPQKYRESNSEAAKYAYFVSYEECKEHFDNSFDIVNQIRSQQIETALHKVKHTSQTEILDNANAFLRRYISYKNSHSEYSELDLRTKPSSNGYWMEFQTCYRKLLITYKAGFGSVDLTFPKAAGEIVRVQEIATWLRKNWNEEVNAVVVGGSAALRIKVPAIVVTETYYEDVPEASIKKSLDAVKKLNDLAVVLEKIRLISSSH